MRHNYLEIVKQLSQEYIPQDEYAVFLFGSRTSGNYHERSDIDIGVLGTGRFSTKVRAQLEEALEESIVPYSVDIIDFSRVSDDFKREALRTMELWNCPRNIKLN